MSIQGFLEERDTRLEQLRDLERRDSAARAWMNGDIAEEVRLLRFDGWVRLELAARIDWSWAGESKARRIEQCRIELENLVLGLWRRGWMLDGKALAGHIRDALDDVRAAQKAGRVRDFWPFYKAVVGRYAGINSEEIRAEAMSAGAAISQVFEQFKKRAPAMPELVAERREETIRERQTRHRQTESRKEAEKTQRQLF